MGDEQMVETRRPRVTRLAHDPDAVAALRRPTVEHPWRILLSGCLAGWPCGVDGTSYGEYPAVVRLFARPEVLAIPFCPEDFALGTPRGTPDVHGGDGRLVLVGRARILDQHGTDLTRAMIRGAAAMLECARAARVDFAVLMDMSAACGSQVISDGSRFAPERRYQRGLGVAAAMLVEAGIPVVSQRDFATHERLLARIDAGHVVDPAARDHHEQDWYRTYFAP